MSSDVAGGCQVRFEVAVGDFERFLLVGKGASAATQQCYVRHVQAMLAELCDATGTIDLGVCRPPGCVRMSRGSVAGMRRSR